MESHPEPVDLPEHLEASLRELGGVRAPDELWQRVAMGLDERVEAPAELWVRVAPAVRAEAAPRPLLRFRRLAAAAAVLVAFGLGFLFLGGDRPLEAEPAFAYYERAALRDSFRAGTVPVRVGAAQLDPAARSLAASLGASLEGRS
jgi:hypothetical protein